jgi:hypothetical protein
MIDGVVLSVLSFLIVLEAVLIWKLVCREQMLHQRIQERDDALIKSLHGTLLRVKERHAGAAQIEMGMRHESAPRPVMTHAAGVARDVGLGHTPRTNGTQ